MTRQTPARPHGARGTTLADSLGAIRLRVTVWYAATFFVILTLLGLGLFFSIANRFDRELDQALVENTRELERVAIKRDHPHAGLLIPLIDSLADIRIPNRRMYLVDTLGRVSAGPTLEPWMQSVALEAWRRRSASGVKNNRDDRILRAYAEAFTTPSHGPLVAMVVADEVELEDGYASLIAILGVGAVVAVILVAAGGWILAGKSTAPVEAAFDHVRQFMADAAHELRTPLSIVRGRAEVALQQPREAGEYAAALCAIEQDSARIGRIVEDLLMLARADAGERQMDRKRVFLDDIALDAANAAHVIAERKGVRLEIGDFDEAAVLGDAELLRQLVLIALDNAIKFTPRGNVVCVAVIGGATVSTLSVADTGIGIPAEQLPHVFDRFYRGDAARARQGTEAVSAGAGLGLSIAKWIADEHDATILVDSVEGEGTQVVVQFPVMAGASDASSTS